MSRSRQQADRRHRQPVRLGRQDGDGFQRQGAGLRRLLRPGLRQHLCRRVHRHLCPRSRCRNHHQRHQWRRYPRRSWLCAGHPAGPTGAYHLSRRLRPGAAASIPPQKLTFEGTNSLVNSVTTDQDVTVIAGRAGPSTTLNVAVGSATALYVQAANNFLLSITDAEGTPAIFQGGSPTLNYRGDIGWDADVVVLGGSAGAPQLVIGADGTVLAVNNVLVNGVAPKVGDRLTGSISVSPIATSGGGNVVMQAENTIANVKSKAGDWPLFQRPPPGSVTIVNLSDESAGVNGLDVVGTPGAAMPWSSSARTAAAAASSRQLRRCSSTCSAGRNLVRRHRAAFTRRPGPGDRRADQQPARSDPAGQPQRLHHLYRRRYRRRHDQPAGRVRAERFGGRSLVAPLQVDLVRYASMGRPPVPPAGRSSTRGWWCDAVGDVYLSLRGVDRANPTATDAAVRGLDRRRWPDGAHRAHRGRPAGQQRRWLGRRRRWSTRIHSGGSRSRTPATSAECPPTTTPHRPRTPRPIRADRSVPAPGSPRP